MAVICPDITTPEWQYAEQELGSYENALILYDMVGREPSEAEVNAVKKWGYGEITARNTQRVWDIQNVIENDIVETTDEGNVRWRTEADGRRKPVLKGHYERHAKSKAAKLSEKYKEEPVTIEAAEYPFKTKEGYNRYPILVKDNNYNTYWDAVDFVGPIREMEEEFVRQEREEMDQETRIEGQEQREGLLTPFEREQFEAQKKVLLKTLPQITEIHEDPNLLVVGVLHRGGNAITVNPLKMTKDTLGHEFGHLLIDLVGGMSNSFIQQGREQLRGTEIEKKVFANYAELVQQADERIDKEILATALGIEIAKIFAEEEKQNKFARWLLRFFRKIKNALGIEKSVVRQLAERLVKGEPLQTKEQASLEDLNRGLYLQGEVSAYEQQQKTLTEGINTLDNLIDKQEELRQKAILVVQRQLEIYKDRAKGKATIEKLESLEKIMLKSSPMKGMLQFTRFALENTRKVYERYLWYKTREIKRGDSKYTAKMLDDWRTFVSSYDMLEDFRSVLRLAKDEINLYGSENDRTLLDELYEQNKDILEAAYKKMYKEDDRLVTTLKSRNIIELMLPLIDEAITLKNTIKNIYVDKGYEIIGNLLSKVLNTEIKGKYMEKADVEYNKLPKEERQKLSRDEYIQKYLDEREDLIIKEANDFIQIELRKAQHGDISYINRWIDTVLNSPDALSAGAAKIITRQLYKANKEIVEAKYEFVERVKALEKQQGRNIATADEDFFDFVIDILQNGNPSQYIVSNLPAQLFIDFKEKVEAIKNEKTSTGKPLNKALMGKRLYKWREEAAPRNKEEYFKAEKEFLEELQEAAIVTSKEIKEWEKNEKKTGRKQNLRELFKENEEAYTEISSWEFSNLWNYRTPSEYYQKLNTKWHTLEKLRKAGLKNGVQTDERVKFYDFIIKMQRKADSYLPYKYRLGYKLPSVLKESMDRLRSGQSLGKVLKRETSLGLTKQKTDIDRGQQQDQGEEQEKLELVNEANEPVNFVPVYYTNEIDVEDQDFDIASIYFNFFKMATDYKYKTELLPELEMIKYYIENREVVKTDSKGNVIKDALYRLNPNVKKTDRTLQGINSNIAGQVDDFFQSVIFGKRKQEEPDLHILGMKIDQAKGLDAINKYTALNLLGVNFIQGFANVTLGEVLQTVDAFAGQYYDTKDLAKATKFYYKNLAGILGDVGERAPSNVVSKLNDLFETLNEYEGGKINRNSRFRELMRTDTLFFTSHAGEHYMQTRLMLAMLNRLQAKDKDGNTIGTMLDMVREDENGFITWDDRVANFSIEEQADFKNRMKRVSAFVHGEYSKEGMNALQRIAIGRMGMMFRKFVVPGAKRRFGKKQWNELLGENTEGNYRTFNRYVGRPFRAGIYKFFKLLGKDLVKFQKDLGGVKWSDLTRLEKANIVRTLGEISFLISAIVLGNFFIKMRDDDDSDDQFWSFMAYQAFRLRAELAFFVNPMETMKILRSPMASMSVVESTAKLFGQLMDPLMSGTFELERYERGPWKEHYKIEKTITQMIPAYKQIYRLRDIDDQLSWFNR